MTKNQPPETDAESKAPTPLPDGPDAPDVEGHGAALREGGRLEARVHVRESDPWTSRGSSGGRRPHKS